jgi:hypothetical protein
MAAAARWRSSSSSSMAPVRNAPLRPCQRNILISESLLWYAEIKCQLCGCTEDGCEDCEHEDDEGKKHTHQTTSSVWGEPTIPIRACKMG